MDIENKIENMKGQKSDFLQKSDFCRNVLKHYVGVQGKLQVTVNGRIIWLARRGRPPPLAENQPAPWVE